MKGRPPKERKVIPLVQHIIQATADYFGVYPGDIYSPCRMARLVYPRHVAMYLAHKHTTASLPDLAFNFDRANHTTIMHAVRKIGALGNRPAFKKIKQQAMAEARRGKR